MPNISIPLAFDTKNSGLHRFPCLEPNVEFSRHAARKPMIARYRQMPRGRPGMPSWSLSATQLLRHRFWAAELLTCGLQQLRYCKPETNFGLRSHNRTICESATDFGLRGHNRTIATSRDFWTAELLEFQSQVCARRHFLSFRGLHWVEVLTVAPITDALVVDVSMRFREVTGEAIGESELFGRCAAVLSTA